MVSSSRTPYIDSDDLKQSDASFEPTNLSKNATLAIICFVSFVAFFDFTIFVFAADAINSVFFPYQDNALLEHLQVIAIFATGFIARPIGAWLIGRYGDKKGRKKALHLSMSLFLLCAAIATILPTYAQIGLIAPILLVIARLLQGAAFASQLILGWVFLIETLPKNRLASAISMSLASVFVGSIACASLYKFLEILLSSINMLNYGWRLMFIASFLLSLLAFFFVQKLSETPLFRHKVLLSLAPSRQSIHSSPNDKIDTHYQQSHQTQSPTNINNTQHANQHYYGFNHFNAILITAFLALIGTSLALLVSLLLPQLLAMTYSIKADVLANANITGIAGLIVGILFYGYIADKIGAAKALMFGAVFLGVVISGFYRYCASSDASLIVPFYGLLGFASGIDFLCVYILIRLFPIYNRLTVTGVVFNIVTVFTGAILPFGLFYLTDIFTLAPALYTVFISMCAFFIGFHIDQSPNIYELEPLPENYD